MDEFLSEVMRVLGQERVCQQLVIRVYPYIYHGSKK